MEMTNIILTISIITFIGIIIFVIDKMLLRVDKERKNISFKDAMDLTGLPILILYQGERKLNFILDSGASHSAINLKDIEGLKGRRVDNEGTAFGIDGNIQETSYVELPLFYDTHEYLEEFQVMDLSQAFSNLKQESGVTVHGILGGSFLTKYRYILDFDKMIAYQRM